VIIASVRRRRVPVAITAVVVSAFALFTVLSAAPPVAGSGAIAARSLPANPPVDANLAGLTVISKTIAPKPTTTRGFNGFQTVTIAAPAGKTVLQGFATLSGGQTGSVVIQSTKTVGGRRFVVQLVFPGTQGTPGKLYVQVQLVPRS
jgi:hypothetical protein